MKIKIIDNLEGKIESLSDSEAEKITALIRQNTQDVNQGEYTPAQLERLNAFATPEKIQEEVKRGFLVTLSNDGGDLIGFVIVIRKGLKLIIKTMQVKTDHCRKGYGSILYTHCENRLKQAGLHEIEVEVPKFPRSEAFYRKHGFTKTGNPTPMDLYFAMFKYL
ncbi:MAG: GNAT family N-acetyltransferase [Desulfobacterales bacterium]|jgi:GNAT superfamily N-acetyltransferase